MLALKKTAPIAILILIVTFAIVSLPAHAAPHEQFAGCASEAEKPYAARFIFNDLYNSNFTFTVVGVGDFDPQITLLDRNGRLVACNNDRRDAAQAGAFLPSGGGGFSERNAQLSLRFYAEENAGKEYQNFELLITNKRGTTGEFILLFTGSDVWDGRNIDSVTLIPNDEQIRQALPLAFYVANLGTEATTLNPQLDLALGTASFLTCYGSAWDCPPDTQSLVGYSATLGDGRIVEMTADDVMLRYQLTYIEGAEYRADISSYQQSSYGPYLFIAYFGVAYPPNWGE